MKKVYSLKKLKQEFITNTDGTVSGTFDEIFTIIKSTKGKGLSRHICTNMMGCETIIATFRWANPDKDDDKIIITYLEN